MYENQTNTKIALIHTNTADNIHIIKEGNVSNSVQNLNHQSLPNNATDDFSGLHRDRFTKKDAAFILGAWSAGAGIPGLHHIELLGVVNSRTKNGEPFPLSDSCM